jgi:hypothetical protein
MSKKSELLRFKIQKLEDEIDAYQGWDSTGEKLLAEMLLLTRQFVELTYKELTNPYAEFLNPIREDEPEHIET